MVFTFYLVFQPVEKQCNIFSVIINSFWSFTNRDFYSCIFPPHPPFPGGNNQIHAKIWSFSGEGKKLFDRITFFLIENFLLNSILLKFSNFLHSFKKAFFQNNQFSKECLSIKHIELLWKFKTYLLGPSFENMFNCLFKK